MTSAKSFPNASGDLFNHKRIMATSWGRIKPSRIHLLVSRIQLGRYVSNCFANSSTSSGTRVLDSLLLILEMMLGMPATSPMLNVHLPTSWTTALTIPTVMVRVAEICSTTANVTAPTRLFGQHFLSEARLVMEKSSSSTFNFWTKS